MRKAALSVLKTALMRAWKHELIPTNPAQLVDPPRISRARREEITPEHVRALLEATAGSVRLDAMLQLACLVPLRPGELSGAGWDAFDLDEATFDVRANLVRHDGEYLLHDTKTHERRTVPLAGVLVDTLRRHRAAQAGERLEAGSAWICERAWVRAEDDWRQLDLVFTRDIGRPWTQQALSKRLESVCRDAGVPAPGAARPPPCGEHAAGRRRHRPGVAHTAGAALRGRCKPAMAGACVSTVTKCRCRDILCDR